MSPVFNDETVVNPQVILGDLVIPQQSRELVMPSDYFQVTIIHDYNRLKVRKKSKAASTPLELSNVVSTIDSVARGTAEMVFSPELVRVIARTSTLENEIDTMVFDDANTSFTVEDSSVVDDRRFNAKGKPVVACPGCGKFYEEKTGLRIHSSSCKGVLPETS